MSKSIDILVVDPDQHHYHTYKELFNDCTTFAVTVEWVRDQQEALELMTKNQHDVYLLAQNSMQQKGIEFLKQSFAKGCFGPVIALGKGEQKEVTAVLEAGAVEHLIEGEFDSALLSQCLENALVRKKLQDMVRETQHLLITHHEQTQHELSRRLHEGPLQDLIGMRLYLGFAVASVEDSETKQHIAFVQQTLQNVIDSLRSYCVDLRPPALNPFGLEKAIRAEGRRYQSQHPELDLTLQLDNDERRLAESLRIALYRIFQQALLNITEHAQATAATIKLQVDSNDVCLEIIDNGQGFLLPDNWIEFARNDKFGLFEAAQQALHVGGILQVKSTTGQKSGTVVRVTAPVPAK